MTLKNGVLLGMALALHCRYAKRYFLFNYDILICVYFDSFQD